ncbi:MAG: hypothetical protein HFE94_01375 [Acutalibacter sp.]|nr:hypothetical protein [Acutalibacter sp.]
MCQPGGGFFRLEECVPVEHIQHLPERQRRQGPEPLWRRGDSGPKNPGIFLEKGEV